MELKSSRQTHLGKVLFAKHISIYVVSEKNLNRFEPVLRAIDVIYQASLSPISKFHQLKQAHFDDALLAELGESLDELPKNENELSGRYCFLAVCKKTKNLLGFADIDVFEQLPMRVKLDGLYSLSAYLKKVLPLKALKKELQDFILQSCKLMGTILLAAIQFFIVSEIGVKRINANFFIVDKALKPAMGFYRRIPGLVLSGCDKFVSTLAYNPLGEYLASATPEQLTLELSTNMSTRELLNSYIFNNQASIEKVGIIWNRLEELAKIDKEKYRKLPNGNWLIRFRSQQQTVLPEISESVLEPAGEPSLALKF